MDAETKGEIFELHARLCKALADPKRLLLISALRDGPKSVTELTKELELPQSNVSQHLAMLRERGVVSAERSGTSVYYSLRDRRIVSAIDLLREVMNAELARRSALNELV